MPLLNDICRCADESCPEREQCARWLERATGGPWTPRAATLRPHRLPTSGHCPSRIPHLPSEAA